MQQRSPISPSATAARNQRLSVIAEDGIAAPPVPPVPPPRRNNRRQSDNAPSLLPIQQPPNSSPQTCHRPSERRWTDKPPHHSAEVSPPGYQHWDDTQEKTRGQLFLDRIRGNAQIAKRGGWKRLIILLVILIAIIIALGVGLGVGLSKRNSSSGDSSSSGNTTLVFPEGSYTIPVYSTIVNTSCTAISSTWLCYPYSTYNPTTPANSLATYTWIISRATSSDSTPKTFNISTSTNPFADMFSNVPLTLQNAGTAEEHYAFEYALTKSVVPNPSIAPNGQTTTCYYNNTILRAALYTQKAKQNVSTSTSAQQSTNSGSNLATANAAWQAWPYAVNVTYSIAGGQDVPACYIMNGDGTMGTRVTQGLTVQSSSRSCVCGYSNFGL